MPHLRFYRAILSLDFSAIKSQRATVQLHAATLLRKQTKPTRLITIVFVGCLAKQKRTINRRVQKRLDMEQFHHFGTVFAKEDRETGKVVHKPCLFIAKFHNTGPTGPDWTGPDQTKSAHCVGDMLNSTTRARPDATELARTRTKFFAARVSEKLRWVRAGLRQSPCGSVQVRAGPRGSGPDARVVEFSHCDCGAVKVAHTQLPSIGFRS